MFEGVFNLKVDSVLSSYYTAEFKNTVVEKDVLIIDLKNETNSDLKFKSEQYSIFIFGKIYNLNCLKKKKDFDESTAEFILKHYLLVGNSFFDRLNGDFVICIHNSDLKKTIFVRDHFGICPFYYFEFENQLIFSSNETLLFSILKKTDKSLNKELLLYQFILVDQNNFLSKKIKSIPPGAILSCEKDQIKIEKYWFPSKLKKKRFGSKDQIYLEFEALLKNAVEIRVPKDTNFASHVSAGLDSSFIAAHLKEIAPSFFKFGLSQSPRDVDVEKIDYNEKELVEEIGEKLNLKIHFTDVYKNDFFTLFEKIPSYLASFHEYYMLEICEENKVKVIFSGFAGDDFASINNSGITSDLFFQLNWKFLSKYKGIKKKSKYLLYNVFFPLISKPDITTLRFLKRQHKFLKSPYNKLNKLVMKEHYYYRSRRSRHLNTLNNYFLTRNIEYLVQMGQNFNIEYRFPLLDKRIIEFILSIPSKMLFDDTFQFKNRILMRKLCSQYFSEAIYQRSDKSDPAVVQGVEKYYDGVVPILLKNFSKFKLPLIEEIVDLDKLEKEINKLKLEELLKDYDICTFIIGLEYIYQTIIQNDKI